MAQIAVDTMSAFLCVHLHRLRKIKLPELPYQIGQNQFVVIVGNFHVVKYSSRFFIDRNPLHFITHLHKAKVLRSKLHFLSEKKTVANPGF